MNEYNKFYTKYVDYFHAYLMLKKLYTPIFLQKIPYLLSGIFILVSAAIIYLQFYFLLAKHPYILSIFNAIVIFLAGYFATNYICEYIISKKEITSTQYHQIFSAIERSPFISIVMIAYLKKNYKITYEVYNYYFRMFVIEDELITYLIEKS